MRNSIFPRYTLGSRDHQIFDLDKTPGIIQGIKRLCDPQTIQVSDLKPFEFLPSGETKEFDGAERVEIAVFSGELLRGGIASKLQSQIIDLEGGSKLTGPVAWRIAPKPQANPPANPDESFINAYRVGFALVALILVYGALTYLSVYAGLATIGIVVLAALIAFCIEAIENNRKRSIEKMGSVYVLAPAKRTWA